MFNVSQRSLRALESHSQCCTRRCSKNVSEILLMFRGISLRLLCDTFSKKQSTTLLTHIIKIVTLPVNNFPPLKKSVMTQTATQVLENSERLGHLQSELACQRRLQEDGMKEIAEKEICITKLQANIQLLRQEGADTHVQVGRDSRVDEVPQWQNNGNIVYNGISPVMK